MPTNRWKGSTADPRRAPAQRRGVGGARSDRPGAQPLPPAASTQGHGVSASAGTGCAARRNGRSDVDADAEAGADPGADPGADASPSRVSTGRYLPALPAAPPRPPEVSTCRENSRSADTLVPRPHPGNRPGRRPSFLSARRYCPQPNGGLGHRGYVIGLTCRNALRYYRRRRDSQLSRPRHGAPFQA